jgi:hypothetical protein
VNNPTKADDAVTIRVATPLAQVPTPVSRSPLPWAMETASGLFCSLITGATGAVNGVRLNYGCTDKSSIIGSPKAGDPWTATQVTLTSGLPAPGTQVPTTTVKLAKVWQ